LKAGLPCYGSHKKSPEIYCYLSVAPAIILA